MSLWVLLLGGAAALLLSAVGGWPVTAAVLRAAAHSQDSGDQPDAPAPSAAPAAPDAPAAAGRHLPQQPAVPEPAPGARDALRGGTWIGMLERLAITATLLAGYPSGIAFVLAVKGLGRYPELRDHPDVSERFVIGTFASMLWAVGVGIAARVLLAG